MAIKTIPNPFIEIYGNKIEINRDTIVFQFISTVFQRISKY